MTEYADIVVTGPEWLRIPPAADNVRMQVRGGAVAVSSKAAPSGDTGIMLEHGEVVEVTAGVAIWYRGVAGTARLMREAFGVALSGEVPENFEDDQWSLSPGSAAGLIVVDIAAVPVSETAITGLQISWDGGVIWKTLSGLGVGTRTVQMEAVGIRYSAVLRAVNASGAGETSSPKSAMSSTGEGSGVTAVAPGKVAGLTAAPGDGHVTLSWLMPDAGSLPITGYRIESGIDGGWASVGTGTGTSHTLNGLVNGTVYSYRVSAQNGAGFGEASDFVTVTPVAPMVAPGQIAAEHWYAVAGTAPGSLKVTITDPALASAVSVAYRINAGSAQVLEPDAGAYQIGGLVPGALVSVQVALINAVGQGVWSVAKVATAGVAPVSALIQTASDAKIRIVPQTNDDLISVTITSPAYYAGTYAVSRTALAAGPVNLVVPELSGIPAEGETLALRQGLWVYDDALGDVTISNRFYNGAASVSDTASRMSVTSEFLTTVRNVETAAQNGVTVSASSLVMPIERVDTFDGSSKNVSLANYVGASGEPWTVAYAATDRGLETNGSAIISWGNACLVRRGQAEHGARQYATVDFTRSTMAEGTTYDRREMGLAVRMRGQQAYVLLFNGIDLTDVSMTGRDETWFLYYVNGTTLTELGSFANDFADFNDSKTRVRMRLEAHGPVVSAKCGVRTLLSVTDTRLSGGAAGLFGRRSGVSGVANVLLDNYAGGAL